MILLRGAVDGLNVVIPYADGAYYQERQSIAIAPPGKPDGALALDGHFGLHPALASLMPLWTERRLAFVHAAGSPDPTRSHFDAQLYLENGTPGQDTTRDGWMNRLLLALPGPRGATDAISIGPTVPRILARQGTRRHSAARPERRPAAADRSAGNRQRLRSALFRQ